MKIVAGLQIFEEIDFIDSCIHSCCNSFDRVVVVEGSWSNTRKIAGDRSRDGTIEKIKELQLIYDNLELFFYNGDDQVSHRNFVWQKCKKYRPHWYLQGDGDEVFHEKDKFKIREVLSGYRSLDSVSPDHFLFWHDLKHYEYWNTGGSRFFNVEGLELDEVHAGPGCNDMFYKNGSTKTIFRRHPTNEFYIYHPSYAKNIKRQKLKIDHRSADDKQKFPHYIKNDQMIRGGFDDIKNHPMFRGGFGEADWLKSLHVMDPSGLPKYLR